MSHEAIIVDSGSKFVINKDTRKITKDDNNPTVVQNDHNSERVSISIPRFVDGHDMSICDRVEIHYTNIDANTKEESKDVYVVDDLHLEGDEVLFTWLIARTATKYEGKLNFSVRFICFEGDEIVYDWRTGAYCSIPVAAGCNCSAEPTPEYTDMFESWAQAEFGDIDAALDEIIGIQNTLMGVSE